MTQTLFLIWFAGMIYIAFVQARIFSTQIKVVKKGSSAVYLGLEALMNIAKGAVWPISLFILLLQMIFLKSFLEDCNEAADKELMNYLGIEDEGNWKDWDDDSEED